MKKSLILLLIFIAYQSYSQKVNTEIVDSYIYVQKKSKKAKKWKVVWMDDFSGKEIDTSKWTKIPPNGAAWGKHMTDDPQCYHLEDGKIYLKGISNNDKEKDPRPYLTGGIYTKGKFAFQYGKVEIHAKLECAKGAWPAIWMLAELDKYGKYPRNGEIDIMEHLNYDDIIYQTTHSFYTLDLRQTKNPVNNSTSDVDISKFNTYGLEWYPDKLVFTLNGEETFEYPRIEGVNPRQWPYDQPFYILIDMQLGGNWVGEVDTNDLPVNMIIDYVKVYQ